MTWYAADDDDAPDDPRAWAKRRRRSPRDAFRRGRSATSSARSRRRRSAVSGSISGPTRPTNGSRRACGPARRAPRRLEQRAGASSLGVDAEPGLVAGERSRSRSPRDDAPTFVGHRRGSRRAGRARTVAPRGAARARSSAWRRAWAPALVVWSRAAAVAQHLEAWAIEADVADARAVAGAICAARPSCSAPSSSAPGSTHADDPLLGVQARRARPSGPLEARRVVLLGARVPRRDRRAPGGRVGGVGRDRRPRPRSRDPDASSDRRRIASMSPTRAGVSCRARGHVVGWDCSSGSALGTRPSRVRSRRADRMGRRSPARARRLPRDSRRRSGP